MQIITFSTKRYGSWSLIYGLEMSIFLIFTESEISDSVVSPLEFSLSQFLSFSFYFLLSLFFPSQFTTFARVFGVWSFVIESMGQEKRAFFLPRHTLLAPADFTSLSFLQSLSCSFPLLSLSIPLPLPLLHCIEILPSYKSFRVQHIISGTIRGRLDRGWRDIDCFIYLTARFVTPFSKILIPQTRVSPSLLLLFYFKMSEIIILEIENGYEWKNSALGHWKIIHNINLTSINKPAKYVEKIIFVIFKVSWMTVFLHFWRRKKW